MPNSRYALVISALLFLGVVPSQAVLKVAKIYDGDTVTMADGMKIRLLQIDAPELAENECFAKESKTALVNLLAKKGTITLKADPASASFDRYGRALRYIFVGKLNVNLEMIKIGAAAPYFYQGEKGVYSAAMLKAAQDAKFYKVGLWKTCPGTQLVPTKAITTYKAVGTPVASPTSTPHLPFTVSKQINTPSLPLCCVALTSPFILTLQPCLSSSMFRLPMLPSYEV